MKPFLLLFALVALTLSGCCAAESCDCPDQAAVDDIALRFNRDTLGAAPAGFTQRETIRLFVIRQPLDTSGGARTDTVLLDPHPVPAAGEPDILLRRDRPFARSVIGLGGYRYSVLVLRKPGRPVLYRYELHDVLIDSRYATTSACCTCYENTRKEARLGTGPLLDLHTPSSSQPTIIELRKY
ncbi:MAG: hypothetical protein H7330_09830 [Hymenobacteraceae bacterium]|nr:hypothetical protein [Hymenobacteraceae bacterium]